jgi:putative nucleotidyltransferase with HDIG domain
LNRLGVESDPTPAVERLLEEFPIRAATRMAPRERRTEIAVAIVFLAAAIALAAALPEQRSWDVGPALILVAAYAAVSRIKFAVGSGQTVPTQLVFVPLLFEAPIGWVPLLVVAGNLLGNLPNYLRGRTYPDRAVSAFGDAWFAVGPVLVLGLAEAGAPTWADWPLYVGALGAQFAFDFTASSVREWLAIGLPPGLQLGLIGWVDLVDTLLSPVGLLAAIATVDATYAFLAVLPVAGLMAMFAAEREGRIQQALELSRTYRRTALLLGDVVEADDQYTGVHSRGVVSLAIAVSDELGLDAADRQTVELGALLHDVGKITVPKEIINKSGPLNDDEEAVMRQHTIRGQRMLERIGGSMREVGRVIRASHEHYDGSGYPDGLAGDQIPLTARIVAAADAFSAMTTDRPYRASMDRESALEELRREAGRQFDPTVVEAVAIVAERWGLPRRPAAARPAEAMPLPDAAQDGV